MGKERKKRGWKQRREDKIKGKKEKGGQGRQKRDMEIESCSIFYVKQGDVST